MSASQQRTEAIHVITVKVNRTKSLLSRVTALVSGLGWTVSAVAVIWWVSQKQDKSQTLDCVCNLGLISKSWESRKGWVQHAQIMSAYKQDMAFCMQHKIRNNFIHQHTPHSQMIRVKLTSLYKNLLIPREIQAGSHTDNRHSLTSILDIDAVRTFQTQEVMKRYHNSARKRPDHNGGRKTRTKLLQKRK